MSTHSLTLVDRFASEGTEGGSGEREGWGMMVTNGDDGDAKVGCMGVSEGRCKGLAG